MSFRPTFWIFWNSIICFRFIITYQKKKKKSVLASSFSVLFVFQLDPHWSTNLVIVCVALFFHLKVSPVWIWRFVSWLVLHSRSIMSIISCWHFITLLIWLYHHCSIICFNSFLNTWLSYHYCVLFLSVAFLVTVFVVCTCYLSCFLLLLFCCATKYDCCQFFHLKPIKV